MFKIEINQDGVWSTASEHTKEVDAEAQKQRFIDSGIAPDSLRIVSQ